MSVACHRRLTPLRHCVRCSIESTPVTKLRSMALDMRPLMSNAIDNTLPGYGGYCQIHHRSLPCPSCSSAPQPQPFVGIPWQPQVNPDPWMGAPFFPIAVAGLSCPTCHQDVPADWDHDAFDDD